LASPPPADEQLTLPQQLAQLLLLTNEFSYVD
jgi:hypothetical protein